MSERMGGDSSEQVVREVSRIVNEMSGVQLGDKQFAMVESRLRSRMLKLGISDFPAYLKHLKADREKESQALLSLMTTHHTYFFREFVHFEALINGGLAKIIEAVRARGDRTIRVWSAACSRGPEAYSLAMFLAFHLREMAPDLDFEILGTDVDPESVKTAENGVYRIDDLNQSPAMYGRDAWVRGQGDVGGFGKIRDRLRAKAKFRTLNLLRPGSEIGTQTFDLIFCRNVFIYFDRTQIKSCSEFLLKHLAPSGFLFVGVSETLGGLGLPVDSVAPSVYRHRAVAAAAPAPVIVEAAPSRPMRVLCVDDSPAILSLLKRILTPEQGFEIVGTANNGVAARKWLESGTADVMTLDIHMPEMDGVTFLETTPAKDHPPVLVLSSVNRDDPALGRKILAAGAKDYVEKPSLENLAQAGNEIRSKLKLVAGVHRGAAGSEKKTEPAKTVASGKKRVLIVDDSSTIRSMLRKILSDDPRLEVVGEAEKPSDVEALIVRHRPDVMTLDIHMPEMDGVTLLGRLMPKFAIPAVMISSLRREDGPQVLKALEAGAVDYIQKPGSPKETAQLTADIRERIFTAAQSRVAMGRRRARKASSGVGHEQALVLLGSSTGGTEALRVVFEGLPARIPPILVVQHIPPVFSSAFAERMNALFPFEVKEAADGDEVKSGRVLIAPGGRQMGVVLREGKLFVKITDDAPVNRHRPSVDYLFESASSLGLSRVVAGVLTGMGADGARGLKRLRDRGAHTFAQDEATSVVYGMPREAKALGGVQTVEPIEHVAETIMKLSSDGAAIRRAA